MSSRIIVTGGSGLLGRPLLKQLKSDGFDVVGTAFSRVKDDLVKLDLNSAADVEKLLDEVKPSLVINSAAERAPDQFDKAYDKSYQLNVDSARALAELCFKRSIKLIQISTDYVFDGKSAPYSESSPTCPINAYGQSKADAEKAVLEATQNTAIVLRIPVLYGDEEYIGESAVSSLLAALLDTSKTRKVSSYEVRRPLCTVDLSYVIGQLVAKCLSDESVKGIYQWSGSEVLTKFDMVMIMSKVLQLPANHVQADPSAGTGTPRPRDVTMLRDKMESLGISRDTPFADNVKTYFAKFVSSS
ncbi:Methionine adenosyltransferase 2 subunit beta [Halotydeus destructor]|nr:Methionine adenosyltransferase 2 subunit beta [Halotydeus destructor]